MIGGKTIRVDAYGPAQFKQVLGANWDDQVNIGHPVTGHRAARIVGDDVRRPTQTQSQGLTFLGAAPEEAEQDAKAYVGLSEPVKRPTDLRGATEMSSADRTMPDPAESFES